MPVSENVIDYALNDVIYLPALKDVILAKLYTKKLLEPFLLKNLQIQNKDYTIIFLLTMDTPFPHAS